MVEQTPFSIDEKILTKLGSLAIMEIELACGAKEANNTCGDIDHHQSRASQC